MRLLQVRWRSTMWGKGANLSYMVQNSGECAWSVKVGTPPPTSWSVMDTFDVHICNESVEFIDLRGSNEL